MLLYKAFIQAGDNYKSVVLPYNSPADPTPTIENKISNVEQPIDVFKFNVEKQDTFVVVGGSSSTAMEFIILPNDGSEYVFDNSQYDYEALDDEYMEGDFEGEEEYLIQFDSIEVEAVNNIKGFDPNNPDEELSTDTNGKYKVSKDKEANIKSIISAAKSMGVTNKFTISAILAIVSKESGFVPSSEASYSKTSAKRIKEVFSKFRSKSDAEVDEIKKDPVRFFNIIYGGKYGNSSDEGYKYRGRGFNQITFKGNYSQYSKETNIDIVNDPDLLNTVDVAAKCLIAYFKRNIKSSPSDIKNRYNFSDINSFGNLNDATGAIYHANAGWGKSYSEIVADSTGGRKKAFNNAGPLYNSYNSYM
jgi:predicted chitinase